ncbi:MAG: 2-oxo acid dehydrogenase subunit E2 [Betaproteobacteria bacterium]|nr:2-oxo acid dehydrogenase subunit E2 [Betaproteobacteria bacterium]
MLELRLPSLGADMDEGKLLEWKVRPGEHVVRGQVMCVVDTAKAAVDVEIWQDGTVAELRVQPGETVPVGTILATLLAPGESAAAPPPPAPVTAPPAAARAPRRRISPAARKRAEELGVAVDDIPGSGPDGAVTLQDVELAAAGAMAPAAAPRPAPAASPAAAPLPAPVAPPATTPAAVPDHQAEMRRAIAAAMSRSKREIPHYYLALTVPLARASAWLRDHNARRPVTERLLMAALLLKSVALACRRFPEFNGFWRDETFVPAAAVHAGVAISLRRGGLVAPALHDADGKPLDQVMRELSDLVQRARAGSLRSSELLEPTITVTNLGDAGADVVHAVIYPPQVAIVGFGAVAPRPWVDEDGELRAVPTVIASLAADHRVSDGHRGALFLAEIRDLLQHPESL